MRLTQLIGQVSGFWPMLGRVLLLSLALEIFGLASPLFMQWVLDHVVVTRDTQLLTTLALGFGLLMLVQQGTSLVRSWLLMVINTSVGVQWRANVFAHMTRLPLSYFQNRHLGDIVSRASSVEDIQRTLTSTFVEALFDGLLVLLTLVLMFVYSPTLAWVALIAVLLYLAMRMHLVPPAVCCEGRDPGARRQRSRATFWSRSGACGPFSCLAGKTRAWAPGRR